MSSCPEGWDCVEDSSSKSVLEVYARALRHSQSCHKDTHRGHIQRRGRGIVLFERRMWIWVCDVDVDDASNASRLRYGEYEWVVELWLVESRTL
jgi:hypothetical protein